MSSKTKRYIFGLSFGSQSFNKQGMLFAETIAKEIEKSVARSEKAPMLQHRNKSLLATKNAELAPVNTHRAYGIQLITHKL